MADPLKYEVPEPSWTVLRTADDELRDLVELLHQRGVLRLVNGVLGSLPQVSTTLMEGLYNRAGGNAIQNITALIELIGSMPPEDFRRVCRGVSAAMAEAGETAEARQGDAPGLKGAMKLLHDDQLWRDLEPLLRAGRAFSDALREDTDLGPEDAPPPRNPK